MANAARSSSSKSTTANMKKVDPLHAQAAASSPTPRKRRSTQVHTPPSKVVVIPATKKEARAARKGKTTASAVAQNATPTKRARKKTDSSTTGRLPRITPQMIEQQHHRDADKASVDREQLLAGLPKVGEDSEKFKPVKRTKATQKRQQKQAAASGGAPTDKRAAQSSSDEKPLTAKQRAKAVEIERRKALRAERKQAKRAARTWKFFAVIGTTAVVLVLSIMLVFPVAKSYYQIMREQERLQAEYDAVVVRNEQIQSEIDNLNTNEGIEDYARSELGWIKKGENAATVLNTGDTTGSTSLPKQVTASSIEMPDTWYYRILDKVFEVG